MSTSFSCVNLLHGEIYFCVYRRFIVVRNCHRFKSVLRHNYISPNYVFENVYWFKIGQYIPYFCNISIVHPF